MAAARLAGADLGWQRAGLGRGVLPAAPVYAGGGDGHAVEADVCVGWMTLFIHRAAAPVDR